MGKREDVFDRNRREANGSPVGRQTILEGWRQMMATRTSGRGFPRLRPGCGCARRVEKSWVAGVVAWTVPGLGGHSKIGFA